MTMLCCSPDFKNPAAEARQQAIEQQDVFLELLAAIPVREFVGVQFDMFDQLGNPPIARKLRFLLPPRFGVEPVMKLSNPLFQSFPVNQTHGEKRTCDLVLLDSQEIPLQVQYVTSERSRPSLECEKCRTRRGADLSERQRSMEFVLVRRKPRCKSD